MISSREELVSAANAWVSHATADVRNQISQFINAQHTTVDELANVLAIPADFLHAILNGSANITLEVFAKLLIATDHVLEIKPLAAVPSMTPRGNQHGTPCAAPSRHSRRQNHPMPHDPRMGGMPTPPPTGGYPMPHDPRMGGMPTPPPMGGYPMPHDPRMGGMPTPPPMGRRFGGMPGIPQCPSAIPQSACNTEMPLDDLASKSRPDLVAIIRDNGWANEIDVACVTRTALIDFINSKRSVQPQPVVEQPIPQPTAIPTPSEGELDPQMAAFQQMIENELSQNPNLRNVLSQYQN